METSRNGVLSLVLALAMVFSVMPSLGAVAAQSQSCSNTVVHDAFRTDDTAVEALQNGTTVESTEDNTRVVISEDNRFYNLTFANPNAYCVEFTVKVHRDAIPPASIPGTVESNNEQYEAEWESVADWDKNTTYTEVTVTIEAGDTVTFSPSADRVRVLNWADSGRQRGEGFLHNVTSGLPVLGGENKFEQRKYTFQPNESTEINLDLTRNNSTEKVENWQAQYRISSKSTGWRPVTQDADAPVFYRTNNGGKNVQFVFNNPDAEVRFVAEPTRFEKFQYGLDSYMASWTDIGDLLPF